jgi:hypothetical protein
MNFRIASLLISASVLAGCLPSDEPTNDEYDDVAVAMSSVLVNDDGGDVTALKEVSLIVQSTPPEGLDADGDVYVGGTASFDYSYTVRCQDTAGSTQDACDDNTDRAEAAVTWSGTLASTRYDTEVERTGAWVLADIQSDVVTFNGDSSFTLDSEFTALYRDLTRAYALDYAAEYDVRYLRDADALEGTVTFDVHADRHAQRRSTTIEASYDMEATLTFHGDHTATLVLDGVRSYRLDTDTGELTAE